MNFVSCINSFQGVIYIVSLEFSGHNYFPKLQSEGFTLASSNNYAFRNSLLSRFLSNAGTLPLLFIAKLSCILWLLGVLSHIKTFMHIVTNLVYQYLLLLLFFQEAFRIFFSVLNISFPRGIQTTCFSNAVHLMFTITLELNRKVCTFSSFSSCYYLHFWLHCVNHFLSWQLFYMVRWFYKRKAFEK